MGRLIAVCGKGGKSTIAVNLAYMVSYKSVTLIFDTKLKCGYTKSFKELIKLTVTGDAFEN